MKRSVFRLRGNTANASRLRTIGWLCVVALSLTALQLWFHCRMGGGVANNSGIIAIADDTPAPPRYVNGRWLSSGKLRQVQRKEFILPPQFTEDPGFFPPRYPRAKRRPPVYSSIRVRDELTQTEFDMAHQWLQSQALSETEKLAASIVEFEEFRKKERQFARMFEQREKQRRQSRENVTQGGWMKKSSTLRSIKCHCHGLSAMDPQPSWCSQYNGGADMSTISAAHVCIVEDVCIDGRSKLYFISDDIAEDGSKSEDITIPFKNTAKLKARILYRSNSLEYKAAKSEIARDRSLVDTSPGVGVNTSTSTLVVLMHAFQPHITHFLEPVGALQVAARDLMEQRGRQTLYCAKDDLSCFQRPNKVLSNQADIQDSNLWGTHVLRAALGDFGKNIPFAKMAGLSPEVLLANGGLGEMEGGQEDLVIDGGYQARVTEPRIEGDGEGNDFVCYDKLVLPGSFYGIWPQGEPTESFQANLVRYISQESDSYRSAFAKANETGNALQDERLRWLLPPGGKSILKDERVILMAHRTSKRTVVDWDNLVSLVEKEAARVQAVVKLIRFGDEPFAYSASLAYRAGILIGIHGADLTNMLFQRVGSVVVELNPYLFFENRFYELANALGLKYMAWNCGTHECAFGGDQGRFAEFNEGHGVRYNSTNYSFAGVDGSNFTWSWKGYVGYACDPCHKLSCCSLVHRDYYGTLRDSDIMFGPTGGKHAREIVSVIRDAFDELRWW